LRACAASQTAVELEAALGRFSISRLRVSWKKVPRELGRIGYQIDDFLYKHIGLTSAHVYGKLFVDPHVTSISGQIAMGRKVAIYLIFPRDGVQQSHFVALDYIIKCGYSPIVVSNLPLTEPEQAQFLSRSCSLILRPNRGYDFGGYRDAIRHLGTRLSELDSLAIFNDSNWFPAQPNVNWLAEAESLSLDFVGSVSHGGVDQTIAFENKDINWKFDASRPKFHYGSFSLLIGKNILRSPGFMRFWRKYRASNSKTHTIRRGEFGLSEWVINNGFTHGQTLDGRNLPELLGNLPDARLLEIARNAISFDRPKPTDTQDDFFSGNPHRKALIAYILKEVLKSGQAYALQEFDMIERNGNFIKKLPVSLYPKTAKQTLRILEHLTGPDIETFRAEAREICRKKFGEVVG
jgi:lipopolysaccharide biosynthesis protein